MISIPTTIHETVEEAYADLQATPSYFERFDPNEVVHLIVVEHCGSCGNWHAPEDLCPEIVEE